MITETLYCELKKEAIDTIWNAAATISQLSTILENSGCKLIYSSSDGQDKNYTPKELLELAEQLRTITRVDRELILVQDPIVNTDIFSTDRIKSTKE